MNDCHIESNAALAIMLIYLHVKDLQFKKKQVFKTFCAHDIINYPQH